MGKLRKPLSDEEKRTLLIQQDLQLAKVLAGNDSKRRYRALNNLQKWVEQRSLRMPLTDDDLKRLWKGLFYSMWMSDKPLVQEECAENIAKLVHCSTPEASLRFLKFGLVVLAIEWFGIDHLRLDKFLMFVRRLVRQGLLILKNNEWDEELIEQFGDILLETILKEDNSKHIALTFHITELFLEELAKVSNGQLEEHLLTEFLKPFVKFLSVSIDERQIQHTCKFMFHHLLRQSDEGIEYQERFEAWREQGFPGGTIDSMQKLQNGSTNDDEEEEEDEIPEAESTALDPRAGKVDVELPQLKFNPRQIADLLKEFKFVKGSTTKTRRTITKLINEFEKLIKGEFPLGMKKVPTVEYEGHTTKVRKSAQRFVEFERELLNDNIKNRKRKPNNTNDEVVSKKSKSEEKEESNSEEEEESKSEEDTNVDNDIKKSKQPKLNSINGKKVSKKRKMDEDADFFGNKLMEFIRKSEQNISNVKLPLKKKTMKLKLSDKFSSKFRRNSGTWFVSEPASNMSNGEFVSSPIAPLSPTRKSIPGKFKILQNIVIKDSESQIVNGMQCDKSPVKIVPSLSNPASTPNTPIVNGLDMTVSTSQVSNSKRRRTTIFSGSEWDLPLKEGETEIFIPYPKKKLSCPNNIKATPKKGRFSLDSNIRKNPFADKILSRQESAKKIKFALNLNSSQEVHEHHAQILNSPGIPFDANKKPLKPLLKGNVTNSPINPFYKYKSNFL